MFIWQATKCALHCRLNGPSGVPSILTATKSVAARRKMVPPIWGSCPIGYYEVRKDEGPERITAAVLPKIAASDDHADCDRRGDVLVLFATRNKFATPASSAGWPA